MQEEQQIKAFREGGLTVVDTTGAHHHSPLTGMEMHYTEADKQGYNTFQPGTRLRRHVHRSKDKQRLVAEEITILNHPILLEVAGKQSLVEPGTRVRIEAGVPHSWGVMELGTRLPNGQICTGTPTMMFNYDEPVEGFTLCRETGTFNEAGQVPDFTGNKDELLFPELTQDQILKLPYIRSGQQQHWDGKPHAIPDEERLTLFRPGKIIDPQDFETAIIGFGNVGPTIALSYALKGLKVRVHDTRPEAYEQGMASIDAALAVLVKRRQVTPEEAEATKKRITNMPQLTRESLRGTKFIVEAINEELGPKQALFRKLSDIAPPDAVLASNTSSLDLDKITEGVATNPGRCIGVHVTLPAYFSPAVELVQGKHTNTQTLQTAERLVEHLDREALHVRHTKAGALPPGLFWNRLQTDVILKCLEAIDNGSVRPEEVHLGLTGALAVRWPVVPILDTIKSAGLAVTGQYTSEVSADPALPPPERERRQALIDKYLKPGSPLFPETAPKSQAELLAFRTARDEKLLHILEAQQRARELSPIAKSDPSALEQNKARNIGVGT